jgi:hypothetical protein
MRDRRAARCSIRGVARTIRGISFRRLVLANRWRKDGARPGRAVQFGIGPLRRFARQLYVSGRTVPSRRQFRHHPRGGGTCASLGRRVHARACYCVRDPVQVHRHGACHGKGFQSRDPACDLDCRRHGKVVWIVGRTDRACDIDRNCRQRLARLRPCRAGLAMEGVFTGDDGHARDLFGIARQARLHRTIGVVRRPERAAEDV